jgi:hypothetical protein
MSPHLDNKASSAVSPQCTVITYPKVMTALPLFNGGAINKILLATYLIFTHDIFIIQQ